MNELVQLLMSTNLRRYHIKFLRVARTHEAMFLFAVIHDSVDNDYSYIFRAIAADESAFKKQIVSTTMDAQTLEDALMEARAVSDQALTDAVKTGFTVIFDKELVIEVTDPLELVQAVTESGILEPPSE